MIRKVNKERTNILIIGTLASGSSALVEMLREYENINVLPREFDNFRRPGFVSDQLSYNTSRDYPNVIDNEIRFVSYKWKLLYKSSLWKLFFSDSFNNIWEKDWGKLHNYKSNLINLGQIFLLQELSKRLKSDISFEEKIQHSNEWIKNIGNIYPSKYDFTLFNQALLPWCDINIWTKVFKPFKLICVHRDPRDQLAEMIRRDISFSPFRTAQLSYGQFNIVSIYGNDRKGRFKFLTDALKNRLLVIDEWMKVLGPDKFLLIDFEGLAKNYDIYKFHIEQFLGINKDHQKSGKKYFNPERALEEGIGIFKDYLNDDEIKELSVLNEWYNKKIIAASVEYKVISENLKPETLR